MKYLIVSLLVLLGAQAKSIKYKDCGSTSHIAEVDVTPCDTSPCTLHKGSDAGIGIVFTPNVPSKSLKIVLHGIIGGFPLPFPVQHNDGCSNCTVSCPLVAGQTDHFNYTLPVKSMYPSIKVVVKFELQGDNDAELACIEFAAQIA